MTNTTDLPALHKAVADHITDLRRRVVALTDYHPDFSATADEISKAADELGAALAASAPSRAADEPDDKETVGQLAAHVGAWETPEGHVAFGSWQALAAYHHHVLKGAAKQWLQMEVYHQNFLQLSKLMVL